MSNPFPIRLARADDIPTLETLIPLSARGLMGEVYSPAQLDAAIGPVFGVDRQLIHDGTYFVVERNGQVIACGGWSRRRAVYGGDRERVGEDATIDPTCEPARVRAFFVHPDWVRHGIGRMLLNACEAAIRAAGFHDAVMVATLTGVPLYEKMGYEVVERYEAPLPGGLTLPVVRMAKRWAENPIA